MPDPIADVLRSPLDERRPGRRPWLRPAGYLLAGMAIGAAAGLGGVLVAGGGEATGAATIATFAPAPPPVPEGLPPGFIDTGSGYGLRAEWFMTAGDRFFVGVASAVPSDAARREVRPIGSTILGGARRAVGSWTLSLSDGTRIGHRAEHVDDGVPGMVTVEFDVSGLQPGDVAGLSMAAPVGAGLRVEEATIPVSEFPISGADLGIEIPATELIEVDAEGATRSGISRLVVERLDASWSAARLEWRLEGIPDVGVRVESVMRLAGAVPEDRQAVLIEDSAFDTRFLQLPIPPATPARSGAAHLRSVGVVPPGSYEVTSLDFTWTVTWARYGDARIEVPIDDARWVEAGG